MTGRLYFDYAAGSPILPQAAVAMAPWTHDAANASSLHAEGRRARQAIDESREVVARALGCSFGEAIFAASGTEAANMAIVGAALAAREGSRKRILASEVEHHCVLHTRPLLERLGFRLELVPVDRFARADLDALNSVLSDDVLMVSVMHANNEAGTFQPVDEIAKMAHGVGALYHCDAVQTFLDPSVDMAKLNADFLTVSAHKIGGPQGIGAIRIRAGVKIAPIVVGGGQERELRAGTENVAATVGFAAAVGAVPNLPDNRRAARDAFLNALRVDGLVETVPDRTAILDGHAHVRIAGIGAESMLILLDRLGVAASSGAACSSGSLEPSHVLLACGYSPAEAREGLRFTFGRSTSTDLAIKGARIVSEAAASIRSANPGRNG